MRQILSIVIRSFINYLHYFIILSMVKPSLHTCFLLPSGLLQISIPTIMIPVCVLRFANLSLLQTSIILIFYKKLLHPEILIIYSTFCITNTYKYSNQSVASFLEYYFFNLSYWWVMKSI